MGKRIEIEHETRRTLDGLQSCCRLLEKLARFLSKLLQHPPQEGSAFDAVAAITPALERLDAVVLKLKHCVPGSSVEVSVPIGATATTIDGDPPLANAAAGELLGRPDTGPLPAALPQSAAVAEMPSQCVLRGISPALPVSTVLQFLGGQRKTGTLRVSTQEETLTIEIEDGHVVHAVSDTTPLDERLGNILLKRGAIGAEQLLTFLDEHHASSFRLGEVLEREGLVTREDLCGALEDQVKLLFRRLFAQPEATFYFYDGEQTQPDIHVKMGVTQLLLDSARISDEDTNKQQATSWEDWLK